jgi:hypothetical protein
MRYLLIALLMLGATSAARAEEPQIEEIRRVWAECTAILDAGNDGWVGWRRNYDGGYGDRFEFHEGDGGASVLVQTWLIDAIATQTDTSCFRADGTLAFIFSSMTSPNMAVSLGESPALTREGRLYFDPEGNLIRLLTRILEDGKEVAQIDNDHYQLARGCGLTAPHPDTEAVRDHLISELGDIEGNRGTYTLEPLDWCVIETE